MSKGILGTMIAKYRKEARMTQEELGGRVGVSTQAVSRWECGGTPDVELLPALADCLGVSIDALYGREGTEMVDVRELMYQKVKNAPKENCMELLMEYMIKLQEAAQVNFQPDIEGVYDLLPAELTERTEENQKMFPETCMVVDDRSCMMYGMVKDRLYSVVLPEPEKGFASALKNTEEYIKLFTLLAKPHYLEMLVDINMRKPGEYFTVRSAASRLNISEEEAERILQELYGCLMLDRMEVSDEDCMMEVYCIGQNINLYAFLFFCEEVMQSKNTMQANVVMRESPLFSAVPGTGSMRPVWVVKEEEENK